MKKLVVVIGIMSAFVSLASYASRITAEEYAEIIRRGEEIKRAEERAKAQQEADLKRIEENRRLTQKALYGDTVSVEKKVQPAAKPQSWQEKQAEERFQRIRKEVLKSRPPNQIVGIYALLGIMEALLVLGIAVFVFQKIKSKKGLGKRQKVRQKKSMVSKQAWITNSHFLHPYKFKKLPNGIIEVYENIDGVATLTGKFDKKRMSMEPVVLTEDVMKHLMDLFFNKEEV